MARVSPYQRCQLKTLGIKSRSKLRIGSKVNLSFGLKFLPEHQEKNLHYVKKLYRIDRNV
jgi:hypothetical protein